MRNIPELVKAPTSWDQTCASALPAPNVPHPIDILVMYTPGVFANYGSISGVEAAVQSSIDNGNLSLRNTQIPDVTYVLRGVEAVGGAPFNYDVAKISPALSELSGINKTSSGAWTFPGNAYVEARRENQWADVVALARVDQTVPREGSCGATEAQRYVAAPDPNNPNAPPAVDFPREPGHAFERYSYLVFNPGCDADRLNLAHEMGHLLGMEHDGANSPAYVGSHPLLDPSCPWSFGHRQGRRAGFNNVQFLFRTIMSYNTSVPGYESHSTPPCLQFFSDDCPQIDAYSNPTLEWAGNGSVGTPPYGLQPVGTVAGAASIGNYTATGTAGAIPPSNARDTIRRLGPVVEGFRDRPIPIFANGFQ